MIDSLARWLRCMRSGSALPSLFVGQGVLKTVMFLAPGTLAYFQGIGYSTWLVGVVVGSELYLMVRTAFAMSPCASFKREHGACLHLRNGDREPAPATR